MKEYKILQSDSYTTLSSMVTNALLDGWTIQGGLAVSPTYNGRFYFQALAR